MLDGKLIVLQNHVNVRPGLRQRHPLNKLPFYFPIPPTGDMVRTASANHVEQQVIRRGAVSTFGGPELEEISWDSEFLVPDWFENPRASDPGSGGEFLHYPSYVIRPPAGFTHYGAHKAYRLLRAIMCGGHVVRLTSQDRNTGKVELNMSATIRSITLKETGGEPDTRFYSITFKQYRWLSIRSVPRGGTGSRPRPPRPGLGRYISSPYTVKKTMGIQGLAQRAYRDRTRWRDIVKYNGGARGMSKRGALYRPGQRGGPYILPKGTRFVIPDLSK